jgi:hypothetical protein
MVFDNVKVPLQPKIYFSENTLLRKYILHKSNIENPMKKFQRITEI